MGLEFLERRERQLQTQEKMADLECMLRDERGDIMSADDITPDDPVQEFHARQYAQLLENWYSTEGAGGKRAIGKTSELGRRQILNRIEPARDTCIGHILDRFEESGREDVHTRTVLREQLGFRFYHRLCITGDTPEEAFTGAGRHTYLLMADRSYWGIEDTGHVTEEFIFPNMNSTT